jgi:predicted Holliday junction resolvase-like endonuclease
MSEILSAFTNFKNILCICSECNNISRLSELHLYSNKKTKKTWLDDFESRVRNFGELESEHNSKAKEINEKAILRGRAKVPKMVNNSLSGAITKLKYNPYDIKPINHPIDYVVYDGMNDGEINNVVFLHEKNSNLAELHKSIRDTVKKKEYDWKVARISKEGKFELED